MGTYGYGLHAPLAYGYGYPSVYSGYHYYGKRSAEAEPKADADPYLLYNGPGCAGHYGYAGYGYATPYYSGVHYYGKRSADAEPKAEADPYGYGLGYAGYPYTAYSGLHYYGKRSAEAEPKADASYGYSGYARPYGGYYGYAPPP